MKHKHFNRLLSMLLVVATLFGLMAVPASAATLGDSGTVTIKQTLHFTNTPSTTLVIEKYIEGTTTPLKLLMLKK